MSFLRQCHAFAYRTLSRPPEQPHIERPTELDVLVAEFFLPLELCQSFNRTGRAGVASQKWKIGKLKKDCYQMMWVQNGGRIEKAHLPGRPHVHCVRFSSREPDPEAGWSKNPIDRLRVGHQGLGYIADDSNRAIKRVTWWEPAPREQGFVMVRVWADPEVGIEAVEAFR